MLVTVIEILLPTVKQGAPGHGFRSLGPKFTSVAPVKLVPVSTTLFPPTVEPEGGASRVKVGGAKYVYVWLPDVPPTVTTLTLTGPAVSPGMLWTVICVLLPTTKHVPLPHALLMSAPPKFTSVVVLKLVPVRTTLLPPAVDPDGGARPVNVGAATYVYVRFPDVPPGVTTLTPTPPEPGGAPVTVM